MAFILNYRLLFRGGPDTEWVDHDPVLLAREPGINTTTGGMKIGDGRKKWSQLDYVFGGEDYNLTPGTITSGGTAAATITGKAPHQQLNLTLPYGPRGIQGEKGDTGEPGPAPTFTAGPVTTSAPGTAAAATITGANGTYTLNLTIPRGNTGNTGQQGQEGVKGDRGEKGDRGDVGPSTNIAIGTVTTSTTTPNATITGTAPNQTLNLAIPRGDKGDTGAPGPGNSITPGSITTGAPGTNAAATITGTSPNQVLNLTIPRGDRGQIGPPGPAPTFTAAPPTNLPPGTTPTATISGTDGAYTLNLGIPRGYDGSGVPGGGATGQLLRKNSVTDYDVEWFTPTWAPATHTHAWTDISEKPEAYPPATHTHLYEDMVGTVPTGQLPWANESTAGILDPVLFQRIVGANQYGVAGTLVRRDDAGRAQFADPAADNDATSKRYVDTGLAGKANTAHTHNASDISAGVLAPARLPAATGSAQGALSAGDKAKLDAAQAAAAINTIVLRDGEGRAKFATPADTDDAATKGYVDARAGTDRGTTALRVTAHGADPTGAADSTTAIQTTINSAATFGVGAVEIPAGYYKVSAPFITLQAGVLVYGHGDSTVIVATGAAPAEKIGVFHIGTYNNRAQDPNLFRAGLRDLMIKTTSANQSHQDIINNVCGVILNTDLGDGPKDPDAVHTLRGLTIWDMHIGMAILGRDDQGMKISDVRIRGGNECGLLVGKPTDHPEVIAGVPGGPGGADNKFLNVDVSSANRLGGTRAGIEVHTSNTKFVNSTSWYNRRFGSFAGTAALDRAKFRDGAGWYIKATKNVFIGCTAQENGGHGFITEWPGTQFIACIAESNSYTDAVNDPAKVQEASGFVICNGARDTQVVACRSGNARGPANGQAYGYVVENYAKNQWIESTADQNAKGEVLLGTNPSSMDNVVIRVGSTLHGWPGGAGGTPDWADITGKPATFAPSAHTHGWADVTGKPTTFAPTTHNHTAAQITTGTLDPARLPLSTTATAGAMSAADKTKLDGITGSGGGTSLTPTETATLATLTDALTKTAAERTAYTTYQNLLDQKTVAGTVLTTSSAEDGAAKWNLNYQSTLETNPALADDGSSYIRLPANNNNPNPSKPVHAYLLQPVSVTTGRTYALHARVRSTGTVGADDYFRVMIGRWSGSGNPAYVDASSVVLMAPKGVNANGYVDIVGTWTANVTDANIVFGPQGGFLDNDLLVDRVSILDTTGATQVTDQQVDDARAAWQTAAAASNAAWRNMMPVGALTGAGGGVTTQTISRADYEARRAAGTLDPNILYMVSAA